MAERYAVATGNWSNTGTWDGGTLPGPGDTVHANTYTVTIDQDVTVDAITTAAGTTASAGGGFTTSGSRTINANVVAGTTNCLVPASSVTTLVFGDVYGGASTGIIGLQLGATTVTITGNVYGGTTGWGVNSLSNGSVLIINGNVTGGTSSSGYGVYAQGAGTVTIDGNVTGGSGNNAHGLYNFVAGTVSVSGDVVGGTAAAYGIRNHSTGTVSVTGNVTAGAGTTAYGVYNSSTGKILISGDVTAVGSVAAVHNNSSGIITWGGNAYASETGYMPFCQGRWMIDDAASQVARFATDSGGGTPDALRALYTTIALAEPPDATIAVRGGIHRRGGGVLLGSPF